VNSYLDEDNIIDILRNSLESYPAYGDAYNDIRNIIKIQAEKFAVLLDLTSGIKDFYIKIGLED
jgi:hypothetical protein